MEKLIELLNEYEKTLEPNLQIEWTEVGIKSTPEIVISKKFGFIKWLVENDKINKSKVFSFIDTADKPYEDILCLLALSDEPINDLISFLKDE